VGASGGVFRFAVNRLPSLSLTEDLLSRSRWDLEPGSGLLILMIKSTRSCDRRESYGPFQVHFKNRRYVKSVLAQEISRDRLCNPSPSMRDCAARRGCGGTRDGSNWDRSGWLPGRAGGAIGWSCAPPNRAGVDSLNWRTFPSFPAELGSPGLFRTC
jgi:hypothetical protein